MINHIRHILLLCVPAAMLIACEEDPQPVVYAAPEVEFTMPSDNISANVGQTLTFTATVVSGDKVTSAWYIDGVMVSSAQTFEYAFGEPGTYTVRFEARNGAGSVGHDYTVTVSDRLSIVLSVGDSTSVKRLQFEYLRVAAIVEYGVDVQHEWRVDGEVVGNEAYYGGLQLNEIRTYNVQYTGTNARGTVQKTFNVVTVERPLEISFSVSEGIIAMLSGRTLSITANVLYGGSGIEHKWFLDDALVSEEATFSTSFGEAGDHELRYEGKNAVGETVTRNWTITVTYTGRLFDDFEVGTLGSWYSTSNTPGLELVENPKASGLNTSAQCARMRVNGSGGTSGFFTLSCATMLSAADYDVSNYSGIRFLVYLGQNKYYPRIDYGGTKYASVTEPKFEGEWEVLEYRLPGEMSFDSTKSITFRTMLDKDGANISGGSFDTPTNSRTVYIDDIEFFK